jgi:hypothetical protein
MHGVPPIDVLNDSEKGKRQSEMGEITEDSHQLGAGKGPDTLALDEVEPGKYAQIILMWEMPLRLPKPPEFNSCASTCSFMRRK